MWCSFFVHFLWRFFRYWGLQCTFVWWLFVQKSRYKSHNCFPDYCVRVSAQIPIPNTTRETFMALLEYLYSDHTPIEEGDPVGILVLANQFCQPRLVALAEYYITKELEESISDTCTETSDVDVVDIMEKSMVGILICAIIYEKMGQFVHTGDNNPNTLHMKSPWVNRDSETQGWF